MANEITKAPVTDEALTKVLQTSLYPGAEPASIGMVLAYCHAAGLDPMQKPVHIVPMWDSKEGRMRDVVMPGIGLYRIQASRTGEFAGVSEPEFGPDETAAIGGQQITFPAWCRVTVRRLLASGHIAEFTAVERWRENYAVKGGKEKSVAPNAMWSKRPYGQLAKCAEAQALRKAFPELGSEPTADEMEGKEISMGAAEVVAMERPQAPSEKPAWPEDVFEAKLPGLLDKARTAGKSAADLIAMLETKGALTEAMKNRIHDELHIIEGEVAA